MEKLNSSYLPELLYPTNADEYFSLSNEHTEYADNPHLKAFVTLIPYLGSTIDKYLGDRADKIKQKRLEIFLNGIWFNLQNFREEVDETFVKEEKFYDLFHTCLESSLNTRNKEKQALNISLISKALKGDFQDFSATEDFAKALNDLTGNEIIFLSIIYRQCKANPKQENRIENHLEYSKRVQWREAVENELNMDQNTIDHYLSSIARTGILSKIDGTYLNYTGGHINEPTLLIRAIDAILER